MSRLSPPVAPFSDQLLALDLPDLDEDRRRQVVAFVARRVDGLPSPMKAGVTVVALAVDGLGRALGRRRVVGVLGRRPLPVLGEYVRLVRSLAYAFIWETWPDTTPTGGRPVSERQRANHQASSSAHWCTTANPHASPDARVHQ